MNKKQLLKELKSIHLKTQNVKDGIASNHEEIDNNQSKIVCSKLEEVESLILNSMLDLI